MYRQVRCFQIRLIYCDSPNFKNPFSGSCLVWITVLSVHAHHRVVLWSSHDVCQETRGKMKCCVSPVVFFRCDGLLSLISGVALFTTSVEADGSCRATAVVSLSDCGYPYDLFHSLHLVDQVGVRSTCWCVSSFRCSCCCWVSLFRSTPQCGPFNGRRPIDVFVNDYVFALPSWLSLSLSYLGNIIVIWAVILLVRWTWGFCHSFCSQLFFQMVAYLVQLNTVRKRVQLFSIFAQTLRAQLMDCACS